MSDDILTLAPPPADAHLAYGSDPNQFLDLRLPSSGKGKSPYPLVINIHGGYWRAKYNLDHAGHLCAALTAKGLGTANLEFRRVGNEGGAWPGTFADIRAAYQFLLQNAQRHNLDATRIVVMGHSAGGRSEEHTSELQSLRHLVCRLLLEKKDKTERMSVNTSLPRCACKHTSYRLTS